MGFWDSALKAAKEAINETIEDVKKDPLKFAQKVGKEVINDVKKGTEEFKRAKEKYASYPDERLLDIVRDNSSFMGASKSEKMAALSVLKDRGYDAETLRMIK